MILAGQGLAQRHEQRLALAAGGRLHGIGPVRPCHRREGLWRQGLQRGAQEFVLTIQHHRRDMPGGDIPPRAGLAHHIQIAAHDRPKMLGGPGR